MIIPLKTFGGEFPKTNATLLPDSAAQYALDCNFLSGSLKGIKSRLDTGISGSGIKSIFHYEAPNADTGVLEKRQYWWNKKVNAVNSPLAADAKNRFYWADGTNFYVSRGTSGGNGEPAPTNRWKVGVPRPGGNDAVSAGTLVAKMILPGVKHVALTLYDERLDGSTSNQDIIDTITLDDFTHQGNFATYTFTARASQAITGTTSSEVTAKKKPAAGDWIIRPTKVTIAGKEYPTYYKKGAANDIVVYYDPPDEVLSPSTIVAVKIPATAEITTTSTDDNGIQTVTVVTPAAAEKKITMHQLQGTNWYGSKASLNPPYTENLSTKWIDAKLQAPFSGPMLQVGMYGGTRTEPLAFGIAKVRTDSTKTTWPVDLPGFNASLSETSGSYTLTISLATDRVTTRAYVYTYVNDFGEEGPPSAPFAVDCSEDAEVTLNYLPPPTDYVPIHYVRLYRTATGTTTDFLYVPNATYDGETLTVIDAKGFLIDSTGKVTDSLKQELLGESLSSHNYYPPEQAIKGLCTMANGILAGFKGKEIHFTEPYLPYACNPSTIKPLPYDITGILPFENGLYVTTKVNPFFISGASPESMQDMKITAIQGGLTDTSIVDMGQFVIYASNDGLVTARGLDATLDKSFQFFTREEWRSRYGSVLQYINLSVHDGSLVAWFDDGRQATDGSYGFLVRFEEEAPSLTRLSEPITAAYVNPTDDALYVSNGTRIYEYKAGAGNNSFVWWSKEFIIPKPINFGAMQLVGSGTVTVQVFADGALKHTEAVTITDTGRSIFRLPSGFLARRWSFKITGSGEVQEAYLAQSITELQNV